MHSKYSVALEPPQDGFKFNKTKSDGWILLAEGPPRPSRTAVLFFSTSNAKGETTFYGETMLQQSIESVQNLGQLAGQYQAEMLLGQQDKIHAALRGRYLLFPGTIWWGLNARRVPSLFWGGKRWCLDFSELESEFRAHDLVARFLRVPYPLAFA